MTLILDEHFLGTTLSNKWSTYDANDSAKCSPGGDPADSMFLTRNIVVNNGSVSLMIKRENATDPNCQGVTAHYTGAGFESASTQYQITHGRMEARIRMPQGNLGIVGYALAWCANQDFPPEIVFCEEEGVVANMNLFTQYGDNGATYEYDLYNIDITQWHTYTLDIDTNQLVWWVDGVKITTQPLHFATRTWIFGCGTWACDCKGYCGCPTNTTLPQSMDIQYVKVWDAIPTEAPTTPPSGTTTTRATTTTPACAPLNCNISMT